MNRGLNQLKFGRTESTSEKASGFTVPSLLSLDPVFDSTKNCKMSADLLFLARTVWPAKGTYVFNWDGEGGRGVGRPGLQRRGSPVACKDRIPLGTPAGSYRNIDHRK